MKLTRLIKLLVVLYVVRALVVVALADIRFVRRATQYVVIRNVLPTELRALANFWRP